MRKRCHAAAVKPILPYVRGEIFFGDKPREGLYIDTGAAENLSGDQSLISHEEKVLKEISIMRTTP